MVSSSSDQPSEQPLLDAEAQPVVTVVVDTVKQRKRSCAGIVCVGLLFVLLLALLVPRQPGLHFRALGVTTVDVTNLYVDLKLESRAPVETKWDDLVVRLEWFTTIGTLELATFEQSSSFKTPAFGSKHVFPGRTTYDALDFQVSAFIGTCSTQTVRVRFKGHVKTGDTKYDIRTPWVYITCYVVNDGA